VAAAIVPSGTSGPLSALSLLPVGVRAEAVAWRAIRGPFRGHPPLPAPTRVPLIPAEDVQDSAEIVFSPTRSFAAWPGKLGSVAGNGPSVSFCLFTLSVYPVGAWLSLASTIRPPESTTRLRPDRAIKREETLFLRRSRLFPIPQLKSVSFFPTRTGRRVDIKITSPSARAYVSPGLPGERRSLASQAERRVVLAFLRHPPSPLLFGAGKSFNGFPPP